MKGDENTTLKNRHLQQYAADVLSETLVTGVPNIVTTPRWPRKIFKLCVLLLCIIGFLYQTVEFLTLVYSYPSMVDISVFTPEEYFFPAIDVCNNNGIMRSKFCEKYPERCETPENKAEFCDANRHFSQYCKDETEWEKFKVPKPKFYGYAGNASLNDLKQVTQEETSLFKLTPFLADKGLDVTGPHIIFKNPTQFIPCYTINFRAISPEDPLKLTANPLSNMFPTIILTIDFETSETFLPGRKPEGIIAIHSPFEFVSPVQNGIRIKPDKLYNIHMSMTEEELLPLPFESDCMNYTEEWLVKGRRGPRSQQMCKLTCLYDILMKHCNCSHKELAYPSNEDICFTNDEGCVQDMGVSDFTECLTLCKNDCEKKKFSHIVDERVIDEFDHLSIEEDRKRHKSIVAFYFSDPEVVVYKHRPRYEAVEVFSYIGGYIGIWLGISLVAVVDFMECLVLILSFALKQGKRRFNQ